MSDLFDNPDLFDGPDRIIGAAEMCDLYEAAIEETEQVAFLVLLAPLGGLMARLAVDRPTAAILVAPDLAGTRKMLPSGLILMPCVPDDPPDFVECWHAPRLRQTLH